MAKTSGRHVAENTAWPALPLNEWQSTLDTLHMWLQVIGKIKLELVPFVNQWWHVALLPTARGLTSGPIPYGDRVFEIEIDFLSHDVYVVDSTGDARTIALTEKSVASFYVELMDALAALDIQVNISRTPSEVPHTIPFDTDELHRTYDGAYVTRWWRIQLNTTRVLQSFRSRFSGKSSPIMFFWGSFDLNHVRFSGRPADPPQGAPRFIQLAENEENIACGFWPGQTTMSGVALGEPAFYAYIYPHAAGYDSVPVRPETAYYDQTLGEFVLLYDDVRQLENPEQAILDFFQSTYEAAAEAAKWDRSRLESNSAP